MESNSLQHRLVLASELLGEIINGQNVWQVSFVQLQDIRNLSEVVAVLLEVRHEIFERLDIGVHALLLRVGYENDAIHPAQNQLAASIVEYLAWNRIEVNASLEAADRAEIQRKEVEEQSTLSLGGQRDHLAFLLLGRFLIDVLQICRLAAQSGAVVDDFAIDLSGSKVDKAQNVPQRARQTSTCERFRIRILACCCWFYTTRCSITGRLLWLLGSGACVGAGVLTCPAERSSAVTTGAAHNQRYSCGDCASPFLTGLFKIYAIFSSSFPRFIKCAEAPLIAFVIRASENTSIFAC